MRAIVIVLAASAACAARAPGPAAPRFARAFAQAIDARDANAAAALFAPDADASLVPGAPAHGRAAIAAAITRTLARVTPAHVAIGRIWIGRDASVIELAFTASRTGAIGAAVVAFDADGRATAARLYLDVPTIVGQVDPSRLPDGLRVRAPATAPPATTIAIARGTPAEAANLAATDRVWARLDAHDPDGVLAASSADYVYDDFSGPAPLDTHGTHELLVRFLALVPDFAIAARPAEFAAGDDVITESVEHMTFHGRAVTLHGLDVKHFTAGRVTREWQYANGAEVLTELLGLPAPTLP